MLIFDIDSQMSKSLSISNIRLYQFIRQKCKTAIVERPTTPGEQLKEKWIVMIVTHPLLRSLLFDDIECKKTHQPIRQERDESVKKCPKCLQNYIPSQTNYGSYRYHDGFVFDLDQNIKLTNEQAQAVAQKAKLLASTQVDLGLLPRLVRQRSAVPGGHLRFARRSEEEHRRCRARPADARRTTLDEQPGRC